LEEPAGDGDIPPMPARGDDGPGPVNATVASLVRNLRAPLSAGFTVMGNDRQRTGDG